MVEFGVHLIQFEQTQASKQSINQANAALAGKKGQKRSCDDRTKTDEEVKETLIHSLTLCRQIDCIFKLFPVFMISRSSRTHIFKLIILVQVH